MRTRLIFSMLTAAVLVSGCHKAAQPPPDIASVLPNIPLPPQAQGLVREGGADALQFLFVTPVSPDSIVAYYRTMLSTGVFHLVNESVTGKSTAFYAEQDGPSIWVTVGPNGSEGSQVIIAGAKDANGRVTKAPTLRSPDSGVSTPLPVKKP